MFRPSLPKMFRSSSASSQHQQSPLPQQQPMPDSKRHELYLPASAQPLLPDQGTPSADARLLLKARTSWLKAAEIAKLLRRAFSGAFPLSILPAELPASGSLYLYDRKRVKYFRADGHNWRKKADGSAARETHEKLRVENVDTLNCYYAHATEPVFLQRRCYWLLDDDRLVLVHYLEAEVSGRGSKDSSSRASRGSAGRDLPDNGLYSEVVQPRVLSADTTKPPTGFPEPKRRRSSTHLNDFGTLDALKIDSSSQQTQAPQDQNRRNSSVDETRDVFSFGQPPREQYRWSDANALSLQCVPSSRSPAMPWAAQEPLLEEALLPWATCPRDDKQAANLVQDHFYQPDRTAHTEIEMSEGSGTYSSRPSLDELGHVSPLGAEDGMFRIVDISRDVVSSHGGDKVLIVGSASSTCDLRAGVWVDVDGVGHSAQLIQPGVISFITQPHAAGMANLVIRNGHGMVISMCFSLQYT